MESQNVSETGWEAIEPQVNAVAEFLEIVHDFGNPLELLREAISNAVDWGATWIKISFDVDEIEIKKRLVITILDNGNGMTEEVLKRDFWGLGYSPSRERKEAIGEKGHGTKIYLRSESVTVRTQSNEGCYLSECIMPMRDLSKKGLHQPRIKTIDKFLDHTGTEIKIVGYNDNERSKFIQPVVKDYIQWFTKVGSIERAIGIERLKDFKVHLKCIGRNEPPEEIEFGHPFPSENSDIDKLFREKEASAADWYVKRYMKKDQQLIMHPEVTFDYVISVEGDAIKRESNKMIRDRPRSNTGLYRVSDRYGIWLCKDYIPITRVNDWITGFGSGSNAYVLLHGFINCQALKLTANRGDIANTDPLVLEELKSSVQEIISRIDDELDKWGIYTLRGWQEENRTLQQEINDFANRTKNFKNRKVARLDDRLLVEPINESELFGLFITIYALRPELFEFEPLDYNTTRGIDIIARNKGSNFITEGEHWYIELKHTLKTQRFNHTFKHLRWIVCWDFDKNIGIGTELQGIEETDLRKIMTTQDKGVSLYFLDSPKTANKIQILRLKEFLKQKLKLEFELPK